MTQGVNSILQPILNPPVSMEILPQASFGRKDGLIYLLPFSLQTSEFIFSFENLHKTLQTHQERRCILPSHCLEVLTIENWQNLVSEKSKFYLQITSGPELNNYKMKLLDVLDLGFSVQIWFDNPKEYRELHENWQGLYPGQIFLCFLPNKNFDHRLILNYQLKSGLQTLFLPKQSPLDSRLNFEEILWFRQALGEISTEFEILILPKSLISLKSEEREFFYQISYPALENMLMKKNKVFYFFMLLFRGFQQLKMSFLLDVLKQVLLFLAKPTWRSSKAVADLFGFKLVEIVGQIKVVLVRIYWSVYHSAVFVKDQYWEFHRGPYQYVWKVRRAIAIAGIKSKYFFVALPGKISVVGVKIKFFFIHLPGRVVVGYWAFHRGPYQELLVQKRNLLEMIRKGFWAIYGFLFDAIIAAYYAIKNFPGRLRVISWRVFLQPHKLFWLLYSLIYRLIFRLFYTLHSSFYIGKYIVLTSRTWFVQNIVYGDKGIIRLAFKLRGLIYLAAIRFFYSVRSAVQWAPILLQRILTRVFWSLAQIYFWPPRFYGWVVKMLWAFHRGPYQRLLAVILFLRTVPRLMYWTGYHWVCQLRALPQYTYGSAVRLFWWWHRGPYQMLWRLKTWTLVVFNRLYWIAYSFVIAIPGRTAFLMGYARYVWTFVYWQVLLRLWYVLRFPIFKVYWFLSFQFKKRVLKKVAAP